MGGNERYGLYSPNIYSNAAYHVHVAQEYVNISTTVNTIDSLGHSIHTFLKVNPIDHNGTDFWADTHRIKMIKIKLHFLNCLVSWFVSNKEKP